MHVAAGRDAILEELGEQQTGQQRSLPYSTIVVFGDSLSDTHNLFDATNNTQPDPRWFYQGSWCIGCMHDDAVYTWEHQ